MNSCVVIPNYKPSFSHNEQISFDQCIKVFKNHDIYFISPKKVFNENYTQVTGVKYYDDSIFQSRETYSDFMLKDTLYNDFIVYDYILVYQLDAFVFRDEIDVFCEMDYDYIGAPWPYGVCLHTVDESKAVYVGNGGFSLRNTSIFARWTRNHLNEIRALQKNCTTAEDLIIAFIGDLKIAPIEVAEIFSVETIKNKNTIWKNKETLFGAHNIISYGYVCVEEIYRSCGYGIDKQSKKNNRDTSLMQMESEIIENGYTADVIHTAVYNLLKTTKIMIWGTGFYSKKMRSLAVRAGIEIESFIETEPKEKDKFDIAIKSAQDIFNNSMKHRIIVAVQKTDMIERMLENYGYVKMTDYITFKDLIKYIRMYCESTN